MKKILYTLPLLLILCSTSVLSQESKLDSLLDILLFEDEEMVSLMTGKTNFQFLYARTNFENKTFFAGRDIGTDQFNTTAQLVYFHSVGINVGIGAMMYSKFDPKLYATALSAGYSGKFGNSKDYRYRASFDRYFFSKVDSIVERSFNSAVSIGTTLDKDFIGSRLDLSFLMGKEFASQISWDIYGDITLLKLGKYDKIKFEPEISLYFGNEQTAYYELGGFGRLQQYILVEDSKFGLLNTEIMFPFSFDYKDFDLEIGYNINFPRSMFSNEKLPVTTYFNVSLGYLFSLN